MISRELLTIYIMSVDSKTQLHYITSKHQETPDKSSSFLQTLKAFLQLFSRLSLFFRWPTKKFDFLQTSLFSLKLLIFLEIESFFLLGVCLSKLEKNKNTHHSFSVCSIKFSLPFDGARTASSTSTHMWWHVT